jgi:predicted metal-dependent peptidase
MTPDRKITKAKTKLVLDHPFFGAIAMRLDYVPSNSVKGASTDGKSIMYNPEFVDKLTLDEATGLIAHEVMHSAMKHHLRRGAREHKLWNVACDYAINGILDDAGFRLPEGALIDKTYTDQSSERIYDTIYRQIPPQLAGPGEQSEKDQSSADTSWGEVTDGLSETASEKERQQEEEDWDITVANAYQNAKSIGNVPGHLERLIEQVKAKVIDWRDVLRDFMEKSTQKDDYTWMVPNRRYSGSQFIMPSLSESEEMPQVVVGVDTSGSVSKEELERYATEIGSILEDFQCNFTVIFCDTRIRNIQHLSYEDLPFKLEAMGGGGTNFREVFEHIEKNESDAHAIIFFSDMYSVNFGKNLGIPTIWLNTGGDSGRKYAEARKCHGIIVDLKL